MDTTRLFHLLLSLLNRTNNYMPVSRLLPLLLHLIQVISLLLLNNLQVIKAILDHHLLNSSSQTLMVHLEAIKVRTNHLLNSKLAVLRIKKHANRRCALSSGSFVPPVKSEIVSLTSESRLTLSQLIAISLQLPHRSTTLILRPTLTPSS